VRFLERTLIRAAPESVWEVLSDWEGQASWMPDVAWVKPLGAERGLGARFEVRTRVFGVPLATDVMRVTAWDPPTRLRIEHVGVVRGVGEWRLAPTGHGTAFTWFESIRMPPPILGDVALLAYSPWQRWMLRRSIRNLRRRVEQVSGS
jgi:carbon monoxide dehydrogenase subunit G